MESQRTIPQNRALHKFCTMLAEHLNECGLDQRIVLIGSKEKIKSTIIKVFQSQNEGSTYPYDDYIINLLTDAIYEIPQGEIWWTMESVKNNLWRPIQIAMLGIESTTEMTTVSPSGIHQGLMKHLCDKYANYGVRWVDWPSLR